VSTWNLKNSGEHFKENQINLSMHSGVTVLKFSSVIVQSDECVHVVFFFFYFLLLLFFLDVKI